MNGNCNFYTKIVFVVGTENCVKMGISWGLLAVVKKQNLGPCLRPPINAEGDWVGRAEDSTKSTGKLHFTALGGFQ